MQTDNLKLQEKCTNLEFQLSSYRQIVLAQNASISSLIKLSGEFREAAESCLKVSTEQDTTIMSLAKNLEELMAENVLMKQQLEAHEKSS